MIIFEYIGPSPGIIPSAMIRMDLTHDSLTFGTSEFGRYCIFEFNEVLKKMWDEKHAKPKTITCSFKSFEHFYSVFESGDPCSSKVDLHKNRDELNECTYLNEFAPSVNGFKEQLKFDIDDNELDGTFRFTCAS